VGGDVPEGVGIIEIRGYNGKYWAGTDGNIYVFSNSHRSNQKPKPFRLAESMGSQGYFFVTIIFNGKRSSINIHSLICEAFNGPMPKPRMCVRHFDGDKKNNLPGNLKWGTYKENEADKCRHGRTASGEKQGSSKLNEKAIRIIRLKVPEGLWSAKEAAETFGVDSSTIRRIVARKDWSTLSNWVWIIEFERRDSND
jgi:hypothetical protein